MCFVGARLQVGMIVMPLYKRDDQCCKDLVRYRYIIWFPYNFIIQAQAAVIILGLELCKSADDTTVKRDGLADNKRFISWFKSPQSSIYCITMTKSALSHPLKIFNCWHSVLKPNHSMSTVSSFFLCFSSYSRQQNFSQQYKWTWITGLASFLSALLFPYPSRENEGKKRYYPYSLVFCSAWYWESTVYIYIYLTNGCWRQSHFRAGCLLSCLLVSGYTCPGMIWENPHPPLLPKCMRTHPQHGLFWKEKTYVWLGGPANFEQ